MFTQIVEMLPARDGRSDDPSKNYGVHGVDIRMVLKGTYGAVQFVLGTNWQLSHVQREMDIAILNKAREGVTLVPRITTDFGEEFGEAEHLFEQAKRLAGMSRPVGLDIMDLDVYYHPLPTDLGYHSPVPLYEGHSILRNQCSYLDNKPCYYGGSGLNAKKVYDILLTEGSAGVWTYLEEYYKGVFIKRERC